MLQKVNVIIFVRVENNINILLFSKLQYGPKSMHATLLFFEQYEIHCSVPGKKLNIESVKRLWNFVLILLWILCTN